MAFSSLHSLLSLGLKAREHGRHEGYGADVIEVKDEKRDTCLARLHVLAVGGLLLAKLVELGLVTRRQGKESKFIQSERQKAVRDIQVRALCPCSE